MSNNLFIEKISAFINQHKLLDKHRKYIVALSGGADSVCLLRVLISLDYNIEAAHCNFHLRGEESNSDEMFCRNLCKTLGIDLHIAHFDTLKHAMTEKISIEMAARDLRYNYFEELRKKQEASAICVAHHINDVAETMLLNLVRATGTRGLQGILPKRDFVVRPLLCVRRAEIEKYLSYIDQSYKHDKTNFDDAISRNRIRLNILPELEKINSAAISNMQLTAKRMADATLLLSEFVEIRRKQIEKRQANFIVYNIADIENEYFLYLLLQPFGFKSALIENIYNYLNNAKTGKLFSSSTHDLLIDREKIVIRMKQVSRREAIIIRKQGTYTISDHSTLAINFIPYNEIKDIPKQSNICTVDAEKIVFPLSVRNLKSGDHFIPFGMKKFKLVSDYLTDRKKNLFEKQQQQVVVDANDDIVWLINERTDNRYRLNLETKNAVQITFTQQNN